jgi:hypothetical protein
MTRKENESWKTILSQDQRIWTVARHRAADQLVENSKDPQKLSRELWKLFEDTGDYYYASLSKSLSGSLNKSNHE